MKSGGTGKTFQSLPALDIVPAGLEEVKSVIISKLRDKMLGKCLQQLRPRALENCGVTAPASQDCRSRLANCRARTEKLLLSGVLPVTPAAELLTKHGCEQCLGSCENFGPGGTEGLYVFLEAAALSLVTHFSHKASAGFSPDN